MIILNAAVLLFFFLIYLFSLKAPKEWLINIDKKEHKLFFLYPMAELLIKRAGLDKRLLSNSKLTNSIKALYVTNRPTELQRLHWYKRISIIIAVLSIFSFLAILGQLGTDENGSLQDGKYLVRPRHGEGSKEVKLEVTFEDDLDMGSNNDKQIASRNMIIKVEEQRYDDKEIVRVFEEAKKYLKNSVLGENTSAEAIERKLVFSNTIPGTGISVEWKPENYLLIRSDGTVCNEGLTESVITSVKVILLYYDHREEMKLSFKILPKQYSPDEIIERELAEEIQKASEKTEKENYIELPETLKNYKLHWSNPQSTTGVTLTLLGIITALAVWLLVDRDLEQQMKKRQEQLLLDYPEIINKFTLLISAGMTVKQAWSKIAEDYYLRYILQEQGQRKRLMKKKQAVKRYAYEEMLITVNELKLGVSEGMAYEQYGRRLGLLPYIRFSSLITQNLKKGNKGFTELLREEAVEAFENRKETAKRLGEEAGTKLLAPMLMMLLIVFMIILVPSFISFQV